RHRTDLSRKRPRTTKWPGHDGLYDRTGNAVLYRKLSRWDLYRKTWCKIRKTQRVLSGNPTLPRFPESPGVSFDGSQSGRGLPTNDNLSLRNRIKTRGAGSFTSPLFAP